jgi:hypothetical protein
VNKFCGMAALFTCAWVLWQTVVTTTDKMRVDAKPATPVRGIATEAACEAEKRRQLEGELEAGMERPAAPLGQAPSEW